MEFWYTEEHTPNVRFSIRVDRQLYSGQSEFQRIDVFESPEFGRFLTLDGYMMLTEKDEFIYHEMITHVPMCVHPEAENILVIGGGDGGAGTGGGRAVPPPRGQPITIPADARNVTVSSDGRIYANGRQIAQLGFVQFDEEKAVIKEGDNLYKPQPGAQPQQATGVIEQGMLEMSNTSVVTEMVELINNYRVYEAGSKAVQTQDSLLDKAVNDVGRTS